jgi:hypothetical protein
VAPALGDSGGPLFALNADASGFTHLVLAGTFEYEAVSTLIGGQWSQESTFQPEMQPFIGALRDTDGDDTPDECDNCPSVENDQQDADGDGLGDACDADSDGDSIGNATDNCATVPNAAQDNCNADAEAARGAPALGDACDPTPCSASRTVAERLLSSVGSAECQGTVLCAVAVDSAIQWQGVAAGTSSGLDGITSFAHCPCDLPHGTVAQRQLCQTSGPTPSLRHRLRCRVPLWLERDSIALARHLDGPLPIGASPRHRDVVAQRH